MKSSILITLPSLLGLAIATPAGTPVRRDGLALEGRQAGTTIIPACATLTSTATPTISALELYEATLGCTGVQATGTNDTRNDILNGICKPFTLIFARGTGEDPNLGNLVGPPFIYALNATFGTKNVAVQGVNNYPADDAGFCAGGSSTGTADLVTLIEQTQKQCPSTKLCVSGYSQGAQVVHDAAALLSSSATSFINSVVLFGDPDNGKPVGKVPASKVSTVCDNGDNICAGGAMILEPHLSYCHNVTKEAAFAKVLSGL